MILFCSKKRKIVGIIKKNNEFYVKIFVVNKN